MAYSPPSVSIGIRTTLLAQGLPPENEADTSPARFAAWGFLRFAGLLITTCRTPFLKQQRPHLSPPIHPDTERERQGQVALFLLRMHIRYP